MALAPLSPFVFSNMIKWCMCVRREDIVRVVKKKNVGFILAYFYLINLGRRAIQSHRVKKNINVLIKNTIFAISEFLDNIYFIIFICGREQRENAFGPFFIAWSEHDDVVITYRRCHRQHFIGDIREKRNPINTYDCLVHVDICIVVMMTLVFYVCLRGDVYNSC